MKDSAIHLPAVAILMFVTLSGCASSTALIHDPSVLVKDPGSLVGHPRIEKDVARVVALWEPATGKGIDDKNARGFAGQILFFGSGCATGARVHGKVNIYEYDNYKSDSDDEPELLHTFAFEPDAWEAHRAVGTFGHSYGVFIPYMNKHRNSVHCGLKVELVLDDGRIVSTATTEVLLHGKNETSQSRDATRGFVRQKQIVSDVAAKSGQHAVAEPETATGKLETLSIPLPQR
jgi:hypothetical protein